MLEKPLSWIFGVLVLMWVLAILFTTEPQARLDRACMPISFIDRFASAGVALADPEWGATTHKVMEEGHFDCRLILWRVFYEDDWRAANPQALTPSSASAGAPAGPRPTLNETLRRMVSTPVAGTDKGQANTQ